MSWWQIPSIFIDLRKFLFFLYLHNNLAGYRILSCEFFVEHFRFVLLIAWFLRSHSHPLQAVSLPSPVAPRMSPLCPFSAVCTHYVLAVELLLVLWPTHALLTPYICPSDWDGLSVTASNVPASSLSPTVSCSPCTQLRASIVDPEFSLPCHSFIFLTSLISGTRDWTQAAAHTRWAHFAP